MVKFKRKIYNKLLEWKKQNGRTSLLIEGARRVGKSTIVQEFAKNEYKTYIYIDFNRPSNEDVKQMITNAHDLDELFELLKVRFSTELYERQSLIIFDEVQQFPQARALTKYLVEDGRYDYLLTGSLIRIKKNVQNITIPSEEEILQMYPMDFEEFLWAMGDEATVPILKKHFEEKKPLGKLHKELIRKWRYYLLIGGMPQSVSEYLNTKSLGECDKIKKNIIQLYQNDIYKFGDGNEAKAEAIYNNIPGELSKGSKKFRFTSLGDNERYEDLIGAINWLNESHMINTCYNIKEPSVALNLTKDDTSFKCYSSDVGLLVTQSYKNKNYLDNEVYRNIIYDKFNVNEGMIVENYVAQALKSKGYDLYYYSKYDKENPNNNMEIDFIIIQDKKLNPIEVKSGNYRSHTSIDRFKEKFKNNVGTRYVIHIKDLKIKDDIVYLPVYMTMFL